MRKPILAAFAALLFTAGCGSSNPETTDNPGHNPSDVTFAQMMIPHHEQAIEMSRLAATRAGSADVRELAEAIEGAQDPEIRTMKAWLKAWGEDEGSGHMAHDMPGIMSEDTMADLRKAKGEAFDQLFLTSMIAHHEGAIAMAMSEKSEGVHPNALKLADAIIKTQNAEIKQMRTMLN